MTILQDIQATYKFNKKNIFTQLSTYRFITDN